MACTDKDDSIDNIKATKKQNYDDEYKEDNYQHQHGNEGVINKTK